MLLHNLQQACVEFGSNSTWLITAISGDLAELSDPEFVQEDINNTAVSETAKLLPQS